MGMGRRRQTGLHLPPHLHKKGRVYYYVTAQGGKRTWIRLSDRYAEALAQWAKLEGRDYAGVKVADGIDRYLLECLGGLAEVTQAEYRRMGVLLRAVFGHMRFVEVEPHHIAAYLDTKQARVSANREITLLQTVFAYAMRWGWCTQNPCRGVRRHTEKRRERYITDAEFMTIKAAADEQWRCILDLAYLTAMRRGDILNLRLSDITDQALVIRQGKTGARQAFELTAALQSVLIRSRRLRRRVGSLWLFCARDGQPYSVSGWNSAWRRLVARTGLEDLHFHDIRAKALTDANREAGRDYAQALAGHASGEMTEAYVRARDTQTVRPLGRIVDVTLFRRKEDGEKPS